MRFFLFSLTVGMLLLPACTFRTTSTSEAEVSPAAPAPIPDMPPVEAVDEAIGPAEPARISPPPDAEFALDPAPAPPTESSTFLPEESSTKRSSTEDVFNSVTRVLRGAVEGADDETGETSEGSVFGSIGRALSKGFQEAAAENATDN